MGATQVPWVTQPHLTSFSDPRGSDLAGSVVNAQIRGKQWRGVYLRMRSAALPWLRPGLLLIFRVQRPGLDRVVRELGSAWYRVFGDDMVEPMEAAQATASAPPFTQLSGETWLSPMEQQRGWYVNGRVARWYYR